MFNLSAHTPFLQLVTVLPNSFKGWAKGRVLVSGPWSGSSEDPDEVFSLQRSLEISSRPCFYHFLYILMLFLPCYEYSYDLSICVIQVMRGGDAL